MLNNLLLPTELARYQRQISLPEIGEQGQSQLNSAKLLIVGCGGLAATLIPYLTASGIGNITIMDGDKVEITNLQRQILYSEEDVGHYKVECMARFCNKLNSHVTINLIIDFLNDQMININLKNYDLVVDTTDDLWVRYYLNDQCVSLDIPLSFASVQGFKGHCGLLPGKRGPCYRCVFPNPPDLTQLPTCQQTGIFAPTPGLFGVLQASEILKWLLGLNKDKKTLWFEMNCQTLVATTIALEIDPECPCCQLKQSSLTYPVINSKTSIAEMDVETLCSSIITKKVPYFLLDVRTQAEHAAENIGGCCLPLNELSENFQQIPKDKIIIIYCQSGQCSKIACQQLKYFGFTNVYSLKGGLGAAYSLSFYANTASKTIG